MTVKPRDSRADTPERRSPDSQSESPFHAGEQAVQARTGMRERIERAGRQFVRDLMPEQHRELFEELPFLLVGSADSAGAPWASLLLGEPGFASSPDPHTLRVRATPAWGDPLREHLRPGAALGVLGIQLETRRRNRVNGSLQDVSPDGFSLRVGQSFGNCPKYIHRRAPHFIADPSALSSPRPVRQEGPLLSSAAQRQITGADAFFVASAARNAEGHHDAIHGADVSHRGGPPGFVSIREADGQSVLTWPDYVGNFMFQTLGNLTLDPRAGVLFVDFARGDLLSLTGTTEIVWEGPEVEATPGAQRLIRFRPARGYALEAAVPLRTTD